jgi:Zn-dependent alcohol dehydrogenase
MKAAVLYEPGKPLVVEEVVVADPQEREVMVRIKATGVCHSDLNCARGLSRGTMPLILGHEASGVVERVGSGVSRVKPGDRVILSWAPACGHCFYCHEQHPALCQSYNYAAGQGGLWDGTSRLRRATKPEDTINHFSCVSSFAEYAVVPETGCIPMHDDIPFAVGALVGCAVTTGFGAVVNDAKVRAGDCVAVIGVGGVGVNAIQAAAVNGAETIVAIDVNDVKRSVAEKFGATHFFNPKSGDATEFLRGLSHGRGADSAIECTGRPPALTMAYNLVRPGGTLVVVGIAAFGEQFSVTASTLPNSQRKIIGSNYGGGVPEEDIQRILSLYRKGRFDIDSQIGARIGLEQVNEAFEWLEQGVLARSIIEFA